jgi:LPXTG-motif cell wall-anchored protein
MRHACRHSAAVAVFDTTRKTKGLVALAVLATATLAVGIGPAGAHRGDVQVDCYGGTVTLDHDTTPDRLVEVITTVPGTTGLSGHFDESYGTIWSATWFDVPGSVTLNIYDRGHLEYSETAEVPINCSSATTTVPATSMTSSTTIPQATTTTVRAAGETVTTATTIPATTVSPPSPTRTNAAAAVQPANAAQLPRTGSHAGVLAVIGLLATAVGALTLRLLARRRESPWG